MVGGKALLFVAFIILRRMYPHNVVGLEPVISTKLARKIQYSASCLAVLARDAGHSLSTACSCVR